MRKENFMGTIVMFSILLFVSGFCLGIFVAFTIFPPRLRQTEKVNKRKKHIKTPRTVARQRPRLLRGED